MIEKLSRTLVGYLLKENVIENNEDDIEYYQYGLEITISSLLNVALILILGIAFGSIVESIIFLVLFIPIRQFTGGFHAGSYLRCNLSFCVCFTVLISAYWLTCDIITTYIAILIASVCTLVIFARCPIENPNKPISDKRKLFHRITATVMSAVYSSVGIALLSFENKYGALVLYTLLLVTVLIIIAIFKEWRCKYEKR